MQLCLCPKKTHLSCFNYLQYNSVWFSLYWLALSFVTVLQFRAEGYSYIAGFKIYLQFSVALCSYMAFQQFKQSINYYNYTPQHCNCMSL